MTAIQLDVADARQIAAAAAACGDVTVLINNAGIGRGASVMGEGSAEAARAEFETNFYGPLNLSKAFAPILKANGGGAIVNVLSALSWLSIPMAATYSASKSAAWSLTNSLRGELRSQGTQVVGVHVAFMDTDMAKSFPGPKTSPDSVATQTFEALQAGRDEVLADEVTRQLKASLSSDKPGYLAAN